MNIRCPHCRNSIEADDASPLSDIQCPACGSSFSLVGDETVAYKPQVPQTIAHFRLLDCLGTGGFGSVWRAHDTELDRTVAVKIPRKEQLDPQEAEQFLREARAAAQLKHPQIVSIHEVGRAGDTIYIVSDLVEGVTLTDRLSAGPLAIREAAGLAARVALALHHAHEARIVHRDLKPSNIMLDRDGQPHLMDFGLARRDAGEVTMTADGKVLGTPAYMSPEQARGEGHAADRRSDVYSLGVILFETLTGEKPFRGNVRMLLHQVLTEEAPSPRKLNAAIPRDLETICLKCLEKKPEKRFQTARELADELQRFLNGEPIHSRPISRVERAWRWCGRHRAIAGLSALLLLALVGGLVVSSLEAIRADRNAADSQQNADRARALAGKLQASLEAEGEARQQAAGDARRAKRAAELEAQARAKADAEARRATEAAAQEADARRQTRRSLYVAHMNLAGVAGQQGNVGRLQQLLETHMPAAGEDDLRGFEWYYLWRQSHGWHASIEHSLLISEMKLSADGKTLVLKTADGLLSLWSVPGADELGRFEIPVRFSSGAATDFALFSAQATVSPDSAVVALPVADNLVRLFDLKTGRERAAIKLVGSVVQSLAWSPDGTSLALGADDGSLRLWSAETRSEIWALPARPAEAPTIPAPAPPPGARASRGVLVVEFSPDGRQLLTGMHDDTWRLHDAATGDEQAAWKQPQTARLTGFARWASHFAPDGRATIYTSDKGGFVLRAVDGGAERVLTDPNGIIQRAAFSGDGRKLATLGPRSVRLWDVATGNETGAFDLASDLPAALALSPDGGRLAAGTFDGSVALYDTATMHVEQLLRGHAKPVVDLLFTADGGLLVSRALDGAVKYWDLSRPDDLPVISGPRQSVRALCFSEDSRALISLTADAAVTRLDAMTGAALGSRALFGDAPVPPESGSDMSPDGKYVAWNGTDGIVRLIDADSGQEQFRARASKGLGSGIVFSPDGRQLVAAEEGGMRIREIPSGREVALLRALPGYGRAAIRPGGQVAAGIDFSGLRFWNIADGSVVRSIAVPANQMFSIAPSTLVFSPDGRFLVSATPLAIGAQNDTLRLWNAETGADHGVLAGHRVGVAGVRFTPDSKDLVSVGFDLPLRLKVWNVAMGEEVATLEGTVAPPGRVTFTAGAALAVAPNGRAVALGSTDGRINIWRAATDDEVSQLRRRRIRSRVQFVTPGQLGDEPAIGRLGEAIEKGNALRKAGNYKAAAAEYSRAIEADPSDDLAWHYRGVCGFQLGQWEEARRDFAKAIELRPHLGINYLWQATISVKLGQWDRATAEFIRDIEVEPENPDPHYSRAISRLAAGDETGYADACRAMLSHCADAADPGMASRVVYTLVPGRVPAIDRDELVRLATRGVAAFKGNERILGAALYRAGKPAEALAQFDKSHREMPPRAWDHLFLALIHHDLGHTDVARRNVELAAAWINALQGKIPWTELVELDALRRQIESQSDAYKNILPAAAAPSSVEKATP